MKINNKVNQTLALALSIATLSTSFSGGAAYAAAGTVDKGSVQSQEQEMSTYFYKQPVIGDTKLQINTKKLKDENKLAIGDTLQMKLITGGETYKKSLVDKVQDAHIKEDYTTVQVMGPGGQPLIPFREFSAGDVVELYVVKGAQETKVGRVTVKGQKSLTPVVEQTKDKIMISSQMTGSLSMYIYTKKYGKWKNFLFEKKNVSNAISYDFPMEKFKNEHGAKAGDEYVVVHQEAGKGKAITKKMVLKDTYEEPSVDFKERKDSNDMAGFNISLPDNGNLDPTPIQKKLPMLKVVKESKEKTYTLNKTKLPQGFTLVKDGVFYAVSKDTPNNTEFKFSQVGDNFNPSTVATMTYKVDMRKANRLLEELKQYPEEKKENFKETIANIESKLQKEGRTQQEVDQATNALETIILPNLGDKLGTKRQEAIKTIGDLKNLDESKKTAYQAKVIGASSEQEINNIVEEAKTADNKIEDEKNRPLKEKKGAAIKTINEQYTFLTGEHEAYKAEIIKKIQAATTIPEVDMLLKQAEAKNKEAEKDQLEQFRKSTLEQIKKLENLSAEEQANAEKEIGEANDALAIAKISTKYRALDSEYAIKKNLEKVKVEVKEKINKLTDLSEDEKKSFIEEVDKADSGPIVNAIYQRALDKNVENNKAKILEAEKAAKMLEEQRKAALAMIQGLPGLTSEQITQADNDLKAAADKAQIENVVKKYESLSEEAMKAKNLNDAKQEYVSKLDMLTFLTGNDIAKFTKEIQEANTLDLVKEAFDGAVQVNLSKAKDAALERITKLKHLKENEVKQAIGEIGGVQGLEQIKPIEEKYTEISNQREIALVEARKTALEKLKTWTGLDAQEAKDAEEAITKAESEEALSLVVEKYEKIHQGRSTAKAELENARKMAIEEVRKLSDLKPDEMTNFVTRIKDAGSVDEIKAIQKEAVRKNEENLADKNKAQALETAKKELEKLVQEAKAMKLSPNSKLKQKFKNTLKDAEAALQGQSLDGMNGAIQDLKRVLDEVKEEKQVTPPTPGPSDPSQPTPPGPSKPKPPAEPKQKEESTQGRTWYYLRPLRAMSSKEQVEIKENTRDQVPTYVDIENHWAKEAINFSLKENLFEDIVKGNRFEPNKAMTRAEFIAILGRFEKVTEFTANISFQDIDMGAYYGKYVNWAKGMGLVKGMDASHFAPDKTISREEMATILYRYKQMNKINFDGQEKQFKDQNKLPKWAREAVKELSKSKIINGMEDGTFRGKKQLSRAEIAQIVFNMKKLR